MSPRAYAEPKTECYVSIDIETNGPCPGINSMLALGAAAFFGDAEVSRFYAKLYWEPGTTWNPDTAKWWEAQSEEAKNEVLSDREYPSLVMERFVAWVDGLIGDRKVPVAWPAAYDFAFVNWGCWKHVGRNPLGYACLDIRSYADGIARNPRYYGLGEEEVRKLVGEIDKTGLRPHVAVDDAVEQGRLFMALRAWCEKASAA